MSVTTHRFSIYRQVLILNCFKHKNHQHWKKTAKKTCLLLALFTDMSCLVLINKKTILLTKNFIFPQVVYQSDHRNISEADSNIRPNSH